MRCRHQQARKALGASGPTVSAVTLRSQLHFRSLCKFLGTSAVNPVYLQFIFKLLAPCRLLQLSEEMVFDDHLEDGGGGNIFFENFHFCGVHLSALSGSSAHNTIGNTTLFCSETYRPFKRPGVFPFVTADSRRLMLELERTALFCCICTFSIIIWKKKFTNTKINTFLATYHISGSLGMYIPIAKEKNINSRIYCSAALVLTTQYGSEKKNLSPEFDSTKVSTKVMPPIFFLLYVAPGRVFASPTR